MRESSATQKMHLSWPFSDEQVVGLRAIQAVEQARRMSKLATKVPRPFSLSKLLNTCRLLQEKKRSLKISVNCKEGNAAFLSYSCGRFVLLGCIGTCLTNGYSQQIFAAVVVSRNRNLVFRESLLLQAPWVLTQSQKPLTTTRNDLPMCRSVSSLLCQKSSEEKIFGCCNLRSDRLWSSDQSSWLLNRRSRVRFPAIPDFLSSSGSGTGSTQPL
jgi:hypothetical protein